VVGSSELSQCDQENMRAMQVESAWPSSRLMAYKCPRRFARITCGTFPLVRLCRHGFPARRTALHVGVVGACRTAVVPPCCRRDRYHRPRGSDDYRLRCNYHGWRARRRPQYRRTEQESGPQDQPAPMVMMSRWIISARAVRVRSTICPHGGGCKIASDNECQDSRTNAFHG
jgi:hypothetical protein